MPETPSGNLSPTGPCHPADAPPPDGGNEAATLPSPPPDQMSERPTVPPPPPDQATTLPPPTSGPTTAEVERVPGYEILQELGRGGMGVVYLARQTNLNRVVALKMILAGGHAGPQELIRFLAEAEAIAGLQHPNIVPLFEAGQHDGLPYFTLEYVPGGSLHHKLLGTPLAPKEAARLVEQLAKGMDHAHQKGIVHRDLKPANVLLTEEGTPKITDFGIAKRAALGTGMTATGQVMGTPSYMAPEQAEGKGKHTGPAADVYALGAILYECLTGRPPFRGPTPFDTVKQVLSQDPVPPRRLQPKVPRDLETVCLKCLEKDLARRYSSAADLAEDLRRFQVGEPIRARTYTLLDRLGHTLEHSPLSEEFRSWGNLMLLFAAIMLLSNLSVFVLSRGGPPYRWNWMVRVSQTALMIALFGVFRRRMATPPSQAERQLLAIWGGYLVAWLLIRSVSMRMAGPGTTWDEITLYPYYAILSGLAFLAMGAAYWGRCYSFGVAFFALAVLMPLGLRWAPLGFGLLWAGVLGFIGLHFRRLGGRGPE